MTGGHPYRGHVRALLVLGLPLIGGHIAQFLIQIVDTVMMGWYDVTSLAALVLGTNILVVVYLMGAGFGIALAPAVAASVAAGDEPQVRRATRMAMWLSAGYGVAALVFFLNARAFISFLGQPPEVARIAGQYLQIAGWGIIPALLVNLLKSYLAALERTRVALAITVVAALVNAVVNYALIFGNFGAPELGARGAAIASVTVQVVSFAGLVAYAQAATREHQIFYNLWRPDWQALAHNFALGWPIGLTLLAEVGMFAAASVLAGWIGTVELAAHGIAAQVAAIAFFVHLGLSNAATIKVGQALGRRDPVAIRELVKTALAMSLILCGVAVYALLSLPEPIIGAFLDPGDPDRARVIAVGVPLLAVAALFQVADAGQAQALGALRGMHDTRIPMLVAAFGYWALGVPAAYLLGFPLGYGVVGLWMGLVVGLVAVWAGLGLRVWKLAFRPGGATSYDSA